MSANLSSNLTFVPAEGPTTMAPAAAEATIKKARGRPRKIKEEKIEDKTEGAAEGTATEKGENKSTTKKKCIKAAEVVTKKSMIAELGKTGPSKDEEYKAAMREQALARQTQDGPTRAKRCARQHENYAFFKREQRRQRHKSPKF